MRVWPRWRISSSSGSSPKDQVVYFWLVICEWGAESALFAAEKLVSEPEFCFAKSGSDPN